jgi:hypothetical protein
MLAELVKVHKPIGCAGLHGLLHVELRAHSALRPPQQH